jgi:hypothetical protein
MALTIEDRFWLKVDKDGPTPEHCPDLGPCWLWTGTRIFSQPERIKGWTSGGYGQCWGGVERGKMYAHRWSWEIANGPIPDGLKVLHRCDAPPCVRPSHLFLGTVKDNARDMTDKGRARGRWGETHHTAKLSNDHVREIRARHAQGETGRDLAADYGVAHSTISRIVNFKMRRSLVDDPRKVFGADLSA